MVLTHLKLQDFRNYHQQEWVFSPTITLLVGPNAAGKTNILESIYLLASGKSPRVSLEQEMIQEGKELARITGHIITQDHSSHKLEIVLTRGLVGSQRAAKKKYILNDIPRLMRSFVGTLKAVLFRPEDLNIILGTPSQRREFLNNILMQTDYDYRRSLLAYKNGLKQRNRILLKIRDGETDARQLYFWDQLLIKNGDVITRQRADLIDYLENHQNGKGSLVHLVYDHSLISRDRLDQYYEASVAAGTTLVGPHRDDVAILKIKNKKLNLAEKDREYSLAYFGSRGEQRLAVLSLKLSELAFIREKCGEKPVLLLDDIFSELDEKHRQLIFELIQNHQTIMTTTEMDWLSKKILDTMKVIRI